MPSMKALARERTAAAIGLALRGAIRVLLLEQRKDLAHLCDRELVGVGDVGGTEALAHLRSAQPHRLGELEELGE